MNTRDITLLIAAVLATLLHTGYGNCAGQWVEHDGSCYLFGHEKMNWVDAVALCKVYQGDLLEIMSTEENTWIIQQLHHRNMGGIWLGSSDIFQEGSWRWITNGASIGAGRHWSHNQPDNGGGCENCLELRAQFGYRLNDWMCNQLNNIVCKASRTITGPVN